MLSGGSATNYGILFQILGSLQHVCQLTIDATTPSGSIERARLVIEPSRGGDLTIEAGNCQTVEQWKSRRTRHAWTIREIARQVLPDLYGAAPDPPFSQRGQYRFRAEGRIADWSNAHRFFEELQQFDANSFRAEFLPDDEDVRFLSGRHGSMTKRRFFLWLGDQIGRKAHAADARRKSIDHRRLCHVLANFSIPDPETVSELELKIDGVLKPLVDYEREVPNIRLELCGRLLKLAGQGAVPIRPSDLLKSAGIVGTSLANWATISKNVRSCSEDVSTGWRWRYDPTLDVRACPSWSFGKSVLILTGESGAGKTWQLASLIRRTDDSHCAIIALSAEGSADRDLEKAAKIIWHGGAGRERPVMPLAQLIQRIRDCNQELAPGWLTVLIDNVQFMDEARDLMDQPWAAWGARLAIAVPGDVVQHLHNSCQAEAEIIDVDRFSRSQLRDYLRRHGHDWATIREDLREQLRLPLLAGLYAKAGPTAAWSAETEYQVFSEAWRLLREHPSQQHYPDDWIAVRDLAGALLSPGSIYPWTIRQCRDAGLDSQAITRLARIGWLVRENDRVAIRHGRLLNWAVAEALASRVMSRADGVIDDVCHILSDVIPAGQHSAGQQLGYVYMDLLWLVSDPRNQDRKGARRILEAIETALAPNGHFLDTVYNEWLPTLGKRIVDLIAARLTDESALQDRRTIDLSAKALVRIGGNGAIAAAISLIAQQQRSPREVGMRVLAKWPCAMALPMLWSEYRNLEPAPDETQDQRWARQSAESSCEAAIRSCAATDIGWLRETIARDGTSRRAAWLLADILSQIEDESAESIWQHTKNRLAESLADGSPVYSSCVKRFRDRTQTELMRQWALSGDPRKVYPGFHALCVVAPEEAIPVIDRVPAANTGWWAPWFDALFQALPNDTRSRMYELMSRSARDAAYVSQAYLHRSFRLDSKSLKCLLNALDQLLDPDEADDTGDAIFRLLELFGRVGTVELLREFELLRGGDLEAKLVASGRRWLQDVQRHGLKLKGLRKMLLKIGGSGLTRFVNDQLRQKDQFVRRQALETCCILPDEETVNLIAQIAESDERVDGPLANPRGLGPEVMEAFATMGMNELLVRTMLHQEGDGRTLRYLRDGQPPMSNHDLRAAFDALQSDDAKTRKRALFAIGVSGRRDLTPMINRAVKNRAESADDVTGALWALLGLRANDDDSVETFSKYLSVANDYNHRYAAKIGLLESDRTDARQLLLDDLSRNVSTIHLGYDEWVLVVLSRYPETREGAVRIAVKLGMEVPGFRDGFGDPHLLELMGDVDGRNVIEYLVAEACSGDTNLRVEGRKLAAIRALTRRNREEAFDAAKSALLQGKHDRHHYPSALIQIDASHAIPLLCQHLPNERNLLVRRAIGVALRYSGKKAEITTATASLTVGDAEQRAAAAEISGWMGDGFGTEDLARCCGQEAIGWVRRRYEEAMASHEAERHGARIIEALAEASTLDQWRLLNALFELVRPECLTLKDDSLWLGSVLDRFPPVLRKYANERHRDAMRQLEDDLKNRTDE